MNSAESLDRILEAVETLHMESGRTMEPPAANKEIADLGLSCANRFSLTVPESYCSLLRRHDGLEWNGMVFYSTGSRRKGTPSVTEMTQETWRSIKKIAVGNIEDQHFYFDVRVNLYQAYIDCDDWPYREFQTLFGLCTYAFDGRL